MICKKLTVRIVAAAAAAWFLIGSFSYGEDGIEAAQKEKVNLKTAAGEMPPTEQPNEENAAVKKDKAIEAARNLLDSTGDYALVGAHLTQKWNGAGYMWNLDFSKNAWGGGGANFGIDAGTGDVLHFNAWQSYEPNKNYIARFTRDEARELAENYLCDKFRLSMDDFEMLKENPNYYGKRTGGVKEQIVYNFNYVRKYNGVPLNNYTMSISVDGTNGKILNYYFNKPDIDVSSLIFPEKAISRTRALKIYKKLISFNLQYINCFEEKYMAPSIPKIVLAYVPSGNISMINATNGKVLNYDGTETDHPKPGAQEGITNPAPMEPHVKLLDKPVTEMQAKAMANRYRRVAEKLLGIKFDTGEGRNEYYTKSGNSGNGYETWSFNWNKNTGTKSYGFNMAISGETGHVLNINMSQYDYSYDMQIKMEGKAPEIKETIAWEQAKEKALACIKDIIPEQYGFFADENIAKPEYSEESLKNMREFYFNFTRIANGIRFRDNAIGIGIDRTTGELTNFYMNWSDVEFPDAAGVISKEEAANAYFRIIKPELGYFTWGKYDADSGREVYAKTPALIYTFKVGGIDYGTFFIDALAGEPIDWSGKEIRVENASGDEKLFDNWGKRSMELLASQGILDNQGINPDSFVTRAEAVKMMSLAKGLQYYYYDNPQYMGQSFEDVSSKDDYYIFVENAVKNKILTETGGKFGGDAEIAKGEYIRLLANMMGFGDIARYGDIFSGAGLGNNTSGELKGYVSICKALGVLPIKEGEVFDAGSRVTYAEAAAALYKALEYIR